MPDCANTNSAWLYPKGMDKAFLFDCGHTLFLHAINTNDTRHHIVIKITATFKDAPYRLICDMCASVKLEALDILFHFVVTHMRESLLKQTFCCLTRQNLISLINVGDTPPGQNFISTKDSQDMQHLSHLLFSHFSDSVSGKPFVLLGHLLFLRCIKSKSSVFKCLRVSPVWQQTLVYGAIKF